MDANTYINRELSWLEFNRRVLEEAKDETVPLLERVKFLSIFSSNLDEFFMVRIARLKRLIRDNEPSAGPDGLTPPEALKAISKQVHELAAEQHLCFLNTILPRLTEEGIHLLRPEEMGREQERFLEEFFHRTLYPIVTPLAIDPGHPFPYLANRSLCLIFSLRANGRVAPAAHRSFGGPHSQPRRAALHRAAGAGGPIRVRAARRRAASVSAAPVPRL